MQFIRAIFANDLNGYLALFIHFLFAPSLFELSAADDEPIIILSSLKVFQNLHSLNSNVDSCIFVCPDGKMEKGFRRRSRGVKRMHGIERRQDVQS